MEAANATEEAPPARRPVGRPKLPEEERIARRRESQRRYQIANKARIQARYSTEARRAYYEANREKALASAMAWQHANRDHVRAYQTAYGAKRRSGTPVRRAMGPCMPCIACGFNGHPVEPVMREGTIPEAGLDAGPGLRRQLSTFFLAHQSS